MVTLVNGNGFVPENGIERRKSCRNDGACPWSAMWQLIGGLWSKRNCGAKGMCL